MMNYTDKHFIFRYEDKELRLMNQSSTKWAHPYPCASRPNDVHDTLHSSGCGIFTLAHLIDWCTGEKIDVCALADFSCANGGRDEDGTNRPELLRALENEGMLAAWGFHYDMDGNLNDTERLRSALKSGGVALANLREGHIVAVVALRTLGAEDQVLIIDSSRDSMYPGVREHVREVVAGSEVRAKYINREGVCSGEDVHYGMFWVPIDLPKGFNVLSIQ